MDFLWERGNFDPGNPGGSFGKRSAGLYLASNDSLPVGREDGRTAREENQQRAHVRSRCLAWRGTPPGTRPHFEPVWRADQPVMAYLIEGNPQ
jgi:hypothetical protein